jgi:hypothetical protein
MMIIAEPALRQLFDYWKAKCNGRRYPARADIDPAEMRYAVGNIMLVDVERAASLRFRIRLHGSNLLVHHGGELTGKMMDELPDTERRKLVIQTFTDVAITGEPQSVCRAFVLDKRNARYESVILPLSADGISVNMLLVGQFYTK